MKISRSLRKFLCKRTTKTGKYIVTPDKPVVENISRVCSIPHDASSSNFEKDLQDNLTNFEEEEKVSETEHSQKLSFLFLGSHSSGISSTANHFLGKQDEPNSSPEDENLAIWQNTLVSESHSIELLDLPGFLRGHFIAEDAELVIALRNHLKQNLPNKIPEVTFIITRFDDNRFEGESSDFTRMLLALNQIKDIWTDRHVSNVVLVLTFSSNAFQDEIEGKLSRFRNAFTKVFPTLFTLPCAVIDNLVKPEEALEILGRAMQQLRFIKVPSLKLPVEVDPEIFPVSNLLPPNRREINEMLISLSQISKKNEEEDLSNFPFLNSEIFPYFISILPDQNQDSRRNGISHLPGNSLITMGDGFTHLPVSELKIGHKLLTGQINEIAVITNISCFSKKNHSQIGRYLVTCKDSESGNLVGFHYNPKSRKFERILLNEIDPLNLNPLTSDKEIPQFYELELDYNHYVERTGMSGTFISDGLLLFSISPDFNVTML